MIRADISVAVWRRTTAELGCSSPLEGQHRGRHRGCWPPNTFEQLLDVRGGPVCCRRSSLPCPVRVACQDSLFKLWLWRDVREAAQVLVQRNRTNHPYDVRLRPVRLGSGGVLVGGLGGRLRERASTQQRQEDAGQAENKTN